MIKPVLHLSAYILIDVVEQLPPMFFDRLYIPCGWICQAQQLTLLLKLGIEQLKIYLSLCFSISLSAICVTVC